MFGPYSHHPPSPETGCRKVSVDDLFSWVVLSGPLSSRLPWHSSPVKHSAKRRQVEAERDKAGKDGIARGMLPDEEGRGGD